MEIYCITSYSLDSDGKSYVNINMYKNFKDATFAFGEVLKYLDYDGCNDHRKIVEKSSVKENQVKSISVSEEGYWKRPSGYELHIVPLICNPTDVLEDPYKNRSVSLNIVPKYSFSIRAWPDSRSFT